MFIVKKVDATGCCNTTTRSDSVHGCVGMFRKIMQEQLNKRFFNLANFLSQNKQYRVIKEHEGTAIIAFGLKHENGSSLIVRKVKKVD